MMIPCVKRSNVVFFWQRCTSSELVNPDKRPDKRPDKSLTSETHPFTHKLLGERHTLMCPPHSQHPPQPPQHPEETAGKKTSGVLA